MGLIRFFPEKPNVNFLKARRVTLAVAALIMTGSLVCFAAIGLNFGIDFRGGTLIEIETDGPADLPELRSRLGALALGEVTIQEFGAPNDILINIQRQEGDAEAQQEAIEEVKAEIDDMVVSYRRTEFVGPKVGEELTEAGILATLLALLGIAVYVWFRFEWQFAGAALLALVHDVIGTIGFFTITQIEFNLATLAAVLTIAGYSINDTVVIFDRVRESARKYKSLPVTQMLNKALNETITRTLMTSMTTLLALFCLYFFGGEVIRGFTAGLIWGILIGTFSSVGVAVPLLYYMGFKNEPSGSSTQDDPGRTKAQEGVPQV